MSELIWALYNRAGQLMWQEDGAEDILNAHSNADYVCWMDSFKHAVRDALQDMAADAADE